MSGPAEKLLGELGLPPYQAKVLLCLVAAEEPLTSQELAKRSGVPRTSIYATAEALLDRGVIEAARDTTHVRRWQAGTPGELASTLAESARVRYSEDLARIERLRLLAPTGEGR